MPEVEEVQWEKRISAMLKAELKRKGVTYAQLAGKLADIGVMDSEPNIRNKLARGKFTAVFLVQCLTAIGSDRLFLGQ
jgi:hypothetical protein